ncbi:MAG: 16S rRNA (guanine966-N2)-methyltransferase [Oleiphilaceae bacterium]|jgi:16S rRNA (guanine966-N2)-methyltransferase
MRARSNKSASSKNASGSFRVIGGTWGSRRLNFPSIDGLRPTTDRVKETVFNWLASDIAGARVLDLFAGSGSLGFEALSRGAASLTAVERDRSAAQALRDNINLLDKHGDTQTEVLQTDALVWLKQGLTKDVSYDLVFLDPPFRQGLLDQCIELLNDNPILQQGALVYLELEQERNDLKTPAHWALLKEKVAGQVSYRLYEVNELSDDVKV